MCTSNKRPALSPQSDIYVTKMRRESHRTWAEVQKRRMRGKKGGISIGSQIDTTHAKLQQHRKRRGLPNASCMIFGYLRQLLRNQRVKRRANASAWQLRIWMHPVSPPKKASPKPPPPLLSYQSCIVLQTSVVMLSGFFLWSGPGP